MPSDDWIDGRPATAVLRAEIDALRAEVERLTAERETFKRHYAEDTCELEEALRACLASMKDALNSGAWALLAPSRREPFAEAQRKAEGLLAVSQPETPTPAAPEPRG